MQELMTELEWMETEMADMSMEEYAAQAMDTAIYPGALVYPVLGLVGEAGECAEKMKKYFRDNDHDDTGLEDPIVEMSIEQREAMALELGDVLWYLTAAASDLGYSLGEIAGMNLDKLQSRQQRGKIKGDGDDR